MGAKVSKAGRPAGSAKAAKAAKAKEHDRGSVGAAPPRTPPPRTAPPPGQGTGAAVAVPRPRPGAGACDAVEAAPRPFFLGRGNLRRRGWTESGIARFLGDADALAPNPVVPSARHMRLYDEARVARVEATEDWRQWHAASQRRRESHRLRAEERARERADRLARLGVYAEAASEAVNRRGPGARST
ncbi:hypothetical protein LO772_28155 [Yinghuangia sp. ASG 101]|uniref:hypothetical protein n=1 Tax=Yinghuangia sp. ASG 101 TaxID=2896848 RepID=UPI001E42C9A0|nr:hypothetical protein [Yinghuangia sp. ASG 101]UGQ10669.1 hypothetical protein LO772_28155 [Yinghuangia sp. ASG 101]